MKAALLYGIRDLKIVEIDKPSVGPEDILIKVRACGVCPTDVRKYLYGNHDQYPINTGHEWVGEIVEIGEDFFSDDKSGEFGLETGELREGMRVTGAGRGGFAEFAKVPKRILRIWPILEIPSDVSYEEATFTEPLADNVHAVMEQAQVKCGDLLVIIGAGQMGLQQLMLAKMIGANTIVSEILQDRLAYAEKFEADYVINPLEEDPVDAVKKVSRGRKADAVIVTVPSSSAVKQALRMVRKRGRVVLFAGAPKGRSMIEIDQNLIHYDEIILTGSEGIGPRPEGTKNYRIALDLISSRRLPLRELITHRFPLEKLEEAYKIIESKRGLKAMITM